MTRLAAVVKLSTNSGADQASRGEGGARDFRHTFATWLEDAGIPARVIDELMGHEASARGAQHLGSTMALLPPHHPRDGHPGRHGDPNPLTLVVTPPSRP